MVKISFDWLFTRQPLMEIELMQEIYEYAESVAIKEKDCAGMWIEIFTLSDEDYAFLSMKFPNHREVTAVTHTPDALR